MNKLMLNRTVEELAQAVSELENELKFVESQYVEVMISSQVFESCLEYFSHAVVIFDSSVRIEYQNEMARRLFRALDEEAQDTSHLLSSFLDRRSAVELISHMRDLLKLSEPRSIKLILALKTGQKVLAHFSRELSSSKKLFILSFLPLEFDSFSDESFRLAKVALEQLSDAVMITNSQNIIVYVNMAFEEITGFSRSEAIGNTPNMLASGRQSETFYQQMYHQLETLGSWSGEIWNKRKNGSIYPEWLTITSVKDSVSREHFYVSTFSDATERLNARQKLDLLAFHDPLTGLANRTSFISFLNSHLKMTRLNDQSSYLYFVDLDDFKEVNDHYGHDAGDWVLKEAAQRMIATVRQTDYVARLGGDEFVILIKDIDYQGAHAKAQELITQLCQEYRHQGQTYRLGASIGVCYVDHTIQSSDEAVRRADLSMYKAKKEGKNCYAFYDEKMDKESSESKQLRERVQFALKHPVTAIEMHYQPIISLTEQDKPIVAYEALLRLQDEQGAYIPTEKLIQFCEQKGLIEGLGLEIFEAICRDKKSLPELIETEISVNLSPKQFRSHHFIKNLETICQKHGLSLEQFSFEITESAAIENYDLVNDQLVQLQSQGIKVLLDDFGTGYASLSYLRDMPIDILKLDKSFILELFNDEQNQKMVQALISMAKALNLTIVAEGIETESHQQWLTQQGVDFGQGFYIARPMKF